MVVAGGDAHRLEVVVLRGLGFEGHDGHVVDEGVGVVVGVARDLGEGQQLCVGLVGSDVVVGGAQYLVIPGFVWAAQ